MPTNPSHLDLTDDLHRQGTSVVLPAPLTRALAWDVAATLLERHDDLVVLELHPGGGQYDCLSVFERPDKLICHLNVTGSLTHSRWFDHGGERITWLEVLERGVLWAAELLEYVEDVMPSAKTRSAEAVTARACALISGLIALRGDVELLSAVADGSYGSGVRSELVAPYALACDDLVIDGGTLGTGAYRWWFLVRTSDAGQQPVACLDAQTARIWFAPGTSSVALDTLSRTELTSRVVALL